MRNLTRCLSSESLTLLAEISSFIFNGEDAVKAVSRDLWNKKNVLLYYVLLLEFSNCGSYNIHNIL